MRFSIGIDLGGTNIKTGLVSESGEIIHCITTPTNAHSGEKAIASRIGKAICQLVDQGKSFSVDQQDIVGIGIGSAGLIEPKEGVVHFSPNFAGWYDIPLADLVKANLAHDSTNCKISALPIVLENDGNAMAFGELCHGAGVGVKNLVCLTLGTGVGGGIVIDGSIFHGSRNAGAELGHTIIQSNGRLCGCGNYGCLEAYVGRHYIIERTRRKIVVEGRYSSLEGNLNDLTPKIVSDAAKKGDEVAVDIFVKTGKYIGVALTSLAHILNPEMAIIGGGIADAGEKLLFEPIRSELKKRAMDTNADSMRIVKAHLGNQAGLVGAAMLVFQD